MKWPKLTLRDCFWIVLVAAVACGWWSHQRQQADMQRTLVDLKKKEIDRTEAAELKVRHLSDYLASRGYQVEWGDDGKPIVSPFMLASPELRDPLLKAIRDAGFQVKRTADDNIVLIPREDDKE